MRLCVTEVVEVFVITERSGEDCKLLLKTLSEGWDEFYAVSGFLVATAQLGNGKFLHVPLVSCCNTSCCGLVQLEPKRGAMGCGKLRSKFVLRTYLCVPR